jgi:hypothetical protein
MIDPVKNLLLGPPLEATRHPPESRYHGIDIAEITLPDGRTVKYLRRRFVASPEEFALLAEHTVVEKDRLDHLGAKYLGDALQAWRIADGNGVLRPGQLTEEVGATIRITLPQGVPGTSGD